MSPTADQRKRLRKALREGITFLLVLCVLTLAAGCLRPKKKCTKCRKAGAGAPKNGGSGRGPGGGPGHTQPQSNGFEDEGDDEEEDDFLDEDGDGVDDRDQTPKPVGPPENPPVVDPGKPKDPVDPAKPAPPPAPVTHESFQACSDADVLSSPPHTDDGKLKTDLATAKDAGKKTEYCATLCATKDKPKSVLACFLQRNASSDEKGNADFLREVLSACATTLVPPNLCSLPVGCQVWRDADNRSLAHYAMRYGSTELAQSLFDQRCFAFDLADKPKTGEVTGYDPLRRALLEVQQIVKVTPVAPEDCQAAERIIVTVHEQIAHLVTKEAAGDAIAADALKKIKDPPQAGVALPELFHGAAFAADTCAMPKAMKAAADLAEAFPVIAMTPPLPAPPGVARDFFKNSPGLAAAVPTPFGPILPDKVATLIKTLFPKNAEVLDAVGANSTTGPVIHAKVKVGGVTHQLLIQEGRYSLVPVKQTALFEKDGRFVSVAQLPDGSSQTVAFDPSKAGSAQVHAEPAATADAKYEFAHRDLGKVVVDRPFAPGGSVQHSLKSRLKAGEFDPPATLESKTVVTKAAPQGPATDGGTQGFDMKPHGAVSALTTALGADADPFALARAPKPEELLARLPGFHLGTNDVVFAANSKDNGQFVYASVRDGDGKGYRYISFNGKHVLLPATESRVYRYNGRYIIWINSKPKPMFVTVELDINDPNLHVVEAIPDGTNAFKGSVAHMGFRIEGPSDSLNPLYIKNGNADVPLVAEPVVPPKARQPTGFNVSADFSTPPTATAGTLSDGPVAGLPNGSTVKGLSWVSPSGHGVFLGVGTRVPNANPGTVAEPVFTFGTSEGTAYVSTPKLNGKNSVALFQNVKNDGTAVPSGFAVVAPLGQKPPVIYFPNADGKLSELAGRREDGPPRVLFRGGPVPDGCSYEFPLPNPPLAGDSVFGPGELVCKGVRKPIPSK